jgi:hypothetical protein
MVLTAVLAAPAAVAAPCHLLCCCRCIMGTAVHSLEHGGSASGFSGMLCPTWVCVGSTVRASTDTATCGSTVVRVAVRRGLCRLCGRPWTHCCAHRAQLTAVIVSTQTPHCSSQASGTHTHLIGQGMPPVSCCSCCRRCHVA